MIKNQVANLLKRTKFTSVVDGSKAVAHVAFSLSEDAFIYPITPSSPIAEHVEAFGGAGRKNVWGQKVQVYEMQSELGAAGAVHGSLVGGGLTSTYTASQGLLLMMPNMFKIAGEMLPGVFHVAARAVAGQALSIFGDHSDINAARGTGFAFLCANNVQETHDMAIVAHLSAQRSSIPFCHFFDGFRTSHELHKIEMLDYDEIAEMVTYEDVKNFKDKALNPENPILMGSAQSPDIFMQMVERANEYYDRVPEIVKEMMNKVGQKTGRQYNLFDFYGAEDAEDVIVLMGSGSGPTEEVCDYLNRAGEKVGLVKVRLYRPWSEQDFINALPKSVKRISVLDRTKEPGSQGEPLLLDVTSSIYNQRPEIKVIGGRFGLGQKEFTPGQVLSIFDNMRLPTPKNHFTVGIEDDITFHSLPQVEEVDTVPESCIQCVFWGIGGDGTVGANHSAIEIIGDNTDMKTQAYFSYDAKKSGGVTQSHLRFGKEEIKSTYLITKADFVGVHVPGYVAKYGATLVANANDNAKFILNSKWESLEDIEANFPAELKREIAKKNIKLYNIDAEELAYNIGLGNKLSMIMNAVFFKLSEVLPLEQSLELLKNAIVEEFSLKGDDIVNMNIEAVNQGIDKVYEVKYDTEKWLNAEDCVDKQFCEAEMEIPESLREIFNEFIDPINKRKGDLLPVSRMPLSGRFPTSTTRFEKRNVTERVPTWDSEKCIQCNACGFVCPHAVIRPFLLNEEEVANAPESLTTLKNTDKNIPFDFTIGISIKDCVFCQNCIEECPVDALSIAEYSDELERGIHDNWEYMVNKVEHKAEQLYEDGKINKFTPKGAAFMFPYVEFHGACAGCGEAAYVRLLTQMYGDSLVIANATGCTSIWGGYAPNVPYCVDKNGHGPAWGNSLFEDNAEYGLGMNLSHQHAREHVKMIIEKVLEEGVLGDEVLVNNFKQLLENWEDKDASKKFSNLVKENLPESHSNMDVQYLIDRQNMFSKKSFWIIGGDGWSYDIGLAGVIHTLASGKPAKIMVLDTAVYSNTGGQSSKATPRSAIAKFASIGKETPKMELGEVAMSLGCYVASCSLGANQKQFLTALKEAEEFPGAALILCYSPCIGHGVKGAMSLTQMEEKLAVQSGFWPMYRYNPLEEKPFTYDFKKIKPELMQELLDNELRFSQLVRMLPERAADLQGGLIQDITKRHEKYMIKEENQ